MRCYQFIFKLLKHTNKGFSTKYLLSLFPLETASTTATKSAVKTTTASASSITPCINSTWNQNGIVVADTGLSYPLDVAIDSKQNLYIVDYFNNRIQKFDANNSNPPATLLSTSGLQNIVIDKFDNVYFTVNYAVMMFNVTTGNITIVAGNGLQGSDLNQLHFPEGFYVDHNLTVYVSDTENNRVMKWYKDATQGILVAGNGKASNSSFSLFNPFGIFVDEINEKGAMYICDNMNNRIQKYLPGAIAGITVATPFNPWVILLDANGIMYICQSHYNQIIKWIPGSVVGEIIVGGSIAALSLPWGIKFDTNYNLYVADQTNNRVVKFLYQPLSCPSSG
ncbi:unnamed protein product [Rotaria sp. Silwood2]|nr:unnamed protein product [Rotaria sp. Silwood2]CAF4368208.1 unnamed protein product [Rotaria sp. Silwood2]